MKLDISLTRDIDGDRAKRALTSALVSFGDEMDIAIIAEGIETPRSWTRWSRWACRSARASTWRTRSAVTDQFVRRSIAQDDPAVAFVKDFISVAIATASA